MTGICKRDGCDDDAVAVQLVRLDPMELLEDFCRPHHVEQRRADGVLEKVEVVTNRAPIMGVDGSENRRGAQIELDREEIDIDMLVRLGFVKRVAATPAEQLAEAQRQSAALTDQLAAAREQEKQAQAAIQQPQPDLVPPVEQPQKQAGAKPAAAGKA